jgi:hypothetical protein
VENADLLLNMTIVMISEGNSKDMLEDQDIVKAYPGGSENYSTA